MSAGDEITQYLAANGIGTLGQDLYLGLVQDKATVITVVETGGPAPYHDYGPGEIIDHPTVQVLVRNPNYTSGRAKVDEIRDLLDGVANATVSGGRYLSIAAMNDPVYLGKTPTSQGETHEFSVNFATMRER